MAESAIMPMSSQLNICVFNTLRGNIKKDTKDKDKEVEVVSEDTTKVAVISVNQPYMYMYMLLLSDSPVRGDIFVIRTTLEILFFSSINSKMIQSKKFFLFAHFWSEVIQVG